MGGGCASVVMGASYIDLLGVEGGVEGFEHEAASDFSGCDS